MRTRIIDTYIRANDFIEDVIIDTYIRANDFIEDVIIDP